MSSQTEIPGTFADYDVTSLVFSGNSTWSSPSNAGTTGGSYATTTPGAARSDTLQGTNCGFSTSGTINGITLTFSRFANADSGSSNINDIDVYLIASSPGTSPTISANNYAATSTRWPTTAAAASYGTGTTDLWGSSWTSTTINGSGFGGLLAVEGAKTSDDCSVNSWSITVYYTGGGSVPGQVTGLSVSNDSSNPTTALDLSWSAPSGSPTSYTIQRASTLGGTFSTLATGVTPSSYVDSTCTPGTEYAYQVAGVNGVGTGAYSSAAANFTDPSAPGSLAATPASGSQINVSWSAPSLGSTVSVVQYTLNRQTNGGSFSSIYTGSTASYSDTGLSAGTTYGYKVDVEVDVNDTSGSGLTGDLTSAFSSVVSATTFGPGAPVPLFGLEGTGACPFGVTNQMRRNRVEGVRFNNKQGF